jgi:dTDP-4-amino-4,6-dideoxygalactose transaminase
MYYILLPDLETRNYLLDKLNSQGINAIFHYIPLHSSPAGRKYGKAQGDLKITRSVSERILRLPLWVGISHEKVAEIVSVIANALNTG